VDGEAAACERVREWLEWVGGGGIHGDLIPTTLHLCSKLATVKIEDKGIGEVEASAYTMRTTCST